MDLEVVIAKRLLQIDVAEVLIDRLVTTGLHHVHNLIEIAEISLSENISTEGAAVQFLKIR